MKHADLLAALVRGPDVLEHWMIYADALLEEGDPRGELINLDLAIDEGRVTQESVQWADRLPSTQTHVIRRVGSIRSRRFTDADHPLATRSVTAALSG